MIGFARHQTESNAWNMVKVGISHWMDSKSVKYIQEKWASTALTAIQRTDRIVRKDLDQIAVRMIEVDAQT